MVTEVKSMKTIGSKVNDDTYKLLNLVCEKDGVTVSERVKDLVTKFLREEAPFLLIDPQVCLELKRIAEREGLEWREMTMKAIEGFCKKCSEEKKPKERSIVDILCEGEEEKKEEASTEEKKPKRSIVSILAEEMRGIEEEGKKPKEETITIVYSNGREEKVPKESIKILKESVFKKEASTEEKKPKQEGSIEEKLKGFKIERDEVII